MVYPDRGNLLGVSFVAAVRLWPQLRMQRSARNFVCCNVRLARSAAPGTLFPPYQPPRKNVMKHVFSLDGMFFKDERLNIPLCNAFVNHDLVQQIGARPNPACRVACLIIPECIHEHAVVQHISWCELRWLLYMYQWLALLRELHVYFSGTGLLTNSMQLAACIDLRLCHIPDFPCARVNVVSSAE